MTKAELEARIADLEQQLAATASDPREAGMVRLVGMLKAVKNITRDGGRTTACGILTNSASVRTREGGEIKVDLPIDGIIATDNGTDIASQILRVAKSNEWARVAVHGYWTTFGEIGRNDRGYAVAQRRQLRVMRIEVLNSSPRVEEDLSPPPINHEALEEFLPF